MCVLYNQAKNRNKTRDITVKIHPVVNISKVRKYTTQVDGQRKEAS